MAKFAITEITKHDFSKLLNNFYNSPYLCYKSKQVQNELTEAYFFLIKHINTLMKTETHVRPNLVKSVANRKMDMSTNKLNLSNFKSTMKWLRAQININKLRVCMILRAKNRPQEHPKRKKVQVMFIFVYMNAVNNDVLQPLNVHAHHRKQPSVI